MQAWHLKQQGWSQRQIAEALGVSEGAVSQWMARAREVSPEALRRRPPPGAPRQVSPEPLARGLLVSTALHQDIEHMSLLIDGLPQIVLCTVHHQRNTSSLQHQLLDIPIAQTKAEVEPHNDGAYTG